METNASPNQNSTSPDYGILSANHIFSRFGRFAGPYRTRRTSLFYIYCEHCHVFSSPSVNLFQFNLILSLKVATSILTVAITTTLVLAKDLLSLLSGVRNREAERARLISSSWIT